MDGFNAFEIYLWIIPVCVTVFGVVVVVAAIRRRLRSIGAAMPMVLGSAVIMLYVPLWFFPAWRVDRMRGLVQEPVAALRFLVIVVAATVALSCLFCVTVRAGTARRVSLVIAAVLYGTLLSVFWMFVITPLTPPWWPADFDRPDLLVPVRPCRGAMLWRKRREEFVSIDDVWLRFADPRDGGRPEWALSAAGRTFRSYYWLDAQDLHVLRVRVDDPAVIDCDSRARPEPVTAAPWHSLGVDED
jgi:hypothetical protein